MDSGDSYSRPVGNEDWTFYDFMLRVCACPALPHTRWSPDVRPNHHGSVLLTTAELHDQAFKDSPQMKLHLINKCLLVLVNCAF